LFHQVVNGILRLYRTGIKANYHGQHIRSRCSRLKPWLLQSYEGNIYALKPRMQQRYLLHRLIEEPWLEVLISTRVPPQQLDLTPLFHFQTFVLPQDNTRDT
jgi:hypothetical protein